MYYEERLINGILMHRAKPSGCWHQVSIEKMSQRIMELEKQVRLLESEKHRAE